MEYPDWPAYLALKKIDAATFRQKAAGQYAELERLFLQQHPESFTAQKLFLINEIRRQYPLLQVNKKDNE